MAMLDVDDSIPLAKSPSQLFDASAVTGYVVDVQIRG